MLPELRDRACVEVIERGYTVTADLIVDLAVAYDLPRPADPEALARLATGALTNLVREAEIYGSDSAGNDEILIDTWVDVFHTYLIRAGQGF